MAKYKTGELVTIPATPMDDVLMINRVSWDERAWTHVYVLAWIEVRVNGHGSLVKECKYLHNVAERRIEHADALGNFCLPTHITPPPASVAAELMAASAPPLGQLSDLAPRSKRMRADDTATPQTDDAALAPLPADIKAKIDSGAWRLEVGCTKRAHVKGDGYATHYHLYIVDGREKTIESKDRIKAAGFTHYSDTTYAGWQPAHLVSGKKGFGRVTTDAELIRKYEQHVEWNTPRKVANGCWYFRNTYYHPKDYPYANALGPQGNYGPVWGSSWTGD